MKYEKSEQKYYMIEFIYPTKDIVAWITHETYEEKLKEYTLDKDVDFEAKTDPNAPHKYKMTLKLKDLICMRWYYEVYKAKDMSKETAKIAGDEKDEKDKT